jgi:hypothetical protein
MTLKQLVERLGVSVKELEFEFNGECKNCRKMGGSRQPCGRDCAVTVSVKILRKG